MTGPPPPVLYYRHVPIWQTPEGRYWTPVRQGRFGRAETYAVIERLTRKLDVQLGREAIRDTTHDDEE